MADRTVYRIKKLKKEDMKEAKDTTMLKEVREFNRKKRLKEERSLRFGMWFTFRYLSERKKSESFYIKFYKPIVMLRDPILAAWLVIFVNYPIIQVSVPCILVIFYLSMECYYLPQTTKKDTFIELYNPIIYNFINIFFFINSLGVIKSDSGIELFIGIPTIVLLVALMSVNIGLNIVSLIISIPYAIKAAYQYIKNYRKKNKKLKKV